MSAACRPMKAGPHRAIARAVQGRGASPSARARPARGFVDRHPFPGPGLAIRIPGEVTRDKLDILRKADAVFLERSATRPLRRDLAGLAVLLPVKTVGVMGDARSYDSSARCGPSPRPDGMTADYYPFPARDPRPRRDPHQSTRCAASTESSTTSPPNPPARSSGSDP